MNVKSIYNLYLFYECHCMVYDLGNIIEIVSLNLNVCTYVQMERGIEREKRDNGREWGRGEENAYV